LRGGELTLADLVAMCREGSGSDALDDVDALRSWSLRTAEGIVGRILARTVGERVEFPAWGFSSGFDAGVSRWSWSCECGGHKEECREEGGELHF